MVIDNVDTIPDIIIRGTKMGDKLIINRDIWDTILKQGVSHGK